MTTLKELKKELEPYKNTLVIDDFNIVRLVDVIDGDLDFYWVYDSRKGITHTSCVGGWIPLKNNISDEEYRKLVIYWNRNNIEHAV